MAHPTYSAMRIRRKEESTPSSVTRPPHRRRGGGEDERFPSRSSPCPSGETMPASQPATTKGTAAAVSNNGRLLRRNTFSNTTTTGAAKTTTSTKTRPQPTAATLRRRATMHAVLRGSRKLSTKNNPHVGSFRHAPPTTFRSMEVSEALHLSSIFRRSSGSGSGSTATSSSSSSYSFTMKNSPYVGFMRHAPPSASTLSSSSSSFPRFPLPVPSSSSSTLPSSLPSSFQQLVIAAMSHNNNNNHNGTEMYAHYRHTGAGDGGSKNGLFPTHYKIDPTIYRSPKFMTTTTTPTTTTTMMTTNTDSNKEKNIRISSSSSSLKRLSSNFHMLDVIDGRLLGGGEEEDPYSSRIVANPMSSSSPSSTAVKMLSKLTSWLLDPIHEEDDHNDDDDEHREPRRISSSGLKVLAGRPYHTSNDCCDSSRDSVDTDSEENKDDYDDDDDDSSQESDSSSASLETSDIMDDTDGLRPSRFRRRNETGGYAPSSVSSSAALLHRQPFSDLNVSVTEIAEAYYAHQLIDEANAQRRHRQRSCQANNTTTAATITTGDDSSSSIHNDDDENNQLDYVITQMDIARMARNASRHLDVDSILTLPTVVYRKTSSTSRPRREVSDSTRDTVSRTGSRLHTYNNSTTMEGKEDVWSFVMVSGVKSSLDSSRRVTSSSLGIDARQSTCGSGPSGTSTGDAGGDSKTTTDEVCVICLEPFCDGDRLRVLPCDHSFHIGCIDRWLSGSHSYNECFTAGCPTCKKRPSLLPDDVICPSVPDNNDSQNNLGDNNEEQHDDEEDLADMESNPMDGSVPSWAFAKLGSALWQHD